MLKLSHLASCPITLSPLSFLTWPRVFESFHVAWVTGCSRLVLHVSCLRPGIGCIRIALGFSLEVGFRDSNPRAGGAHCYWMGHDFQRFQWTGPRNTCFIIGLVSFPSIHQLLWIYLCVSWPAGGRIRSRADLLLSKLERFPSSGFYMVRVSFAEITGRFICNSFGICFPWHTVSSPGCVRAGNRHPHACMVYGRGDDTSVLKDTGPEL